MRRFCDNERIDGIERQTPESVGSCWGKMAPLKHVLKHTNRMVLNFSLPPCASLAGAGWQPETECIFYGLATGTCDIIGVRSKMRFLAC